MNETFPFALGLGFVLGLKHATEADHLMAVTTIVSEQRSIWRSALVGTLWGVGHTASLLLAGALVVSLRLVIPERVAAGLELGVAVMIMLLGGRVLYLLLRNRREPHIHPHAHGDVIHSHLHFHDSGDAHPVTVSGSHQHHTLARVGWRPIIVGMIHGLAGSATLTLLVLTEIMRGGSALKGILYLLVFGLGSLGGMLAMSAVVSLPFVLTARRFERGHKPIQWIAGCASILFGLYYAGEILAEHFTF